MRRLAQVVVAAAFMFVLGPAPGHAAFGLNGLDVTFTNPDGSPAMQAGSHPFAMNVAFKLNTSGEEPQKFAEGAIKHLEVEQPAGFAGDPTAVPRCSTLDFLVFNKGASNCADSAAVGLTRLTLGGKGVGGDFDPFPVFNLEPPPGVVAKLGFWATEVPVTIEIGVSSSPPYNVVASVRNVSQVLEVFGSTLTLWGNPADPRHDAQRGSCLIEDGSCPAGIPLKPFITLPRSCPGPLVTVFRATSWSLPPAHFAGRAETHDDSIPPNPLGTTGCGNLGFAPRLTAQPTTDQAESPTGFDVSFDVKDEGLTSATGTAHSDMRKVVATLPAGMTLNPSVAEGLLACSPTDLAHETLASAPGEGCPEASNVGTVEVETPVLEGKILKGQLFVAQQDDPSTTEPGAENPFDTMIAIYVVVKDPGLGVLVKQAGKVVPDSRTGQLSATFEDLPQFPLSHIRTRLREGGRSPLISPASCKTYSTKTEFTPWADPSKLHVATSDFRITRGVGGGSCPPAGAPPFTPGFTAGMLNNNAATYSPFYMRLTRRDGDQDLVRFDATLPPGVVAKLAGTSRCPDAAIAAAEAKRGRVELAEPSCPASSEIGRVVGGAGVGSQLTYVPGKLYVAGPVDGAPLSVVVIVPAVAGPFDVGTVVVRQALQVNRRTARVRLDSAASDPIPHMLVGIPLRVRDVRVHVDRPEFTLNPTNCNPFEVAAQIWGGGGDFSIPEDDAPVSLTERFQAANCSRLGFKPRLSFRLKGGTKRGGHPALRSVYRPKRGNANLSKLVVRLPRSAFLDQAHIRTICTRVQFAADRCPKGAIYGRATAFTPLLDKPLKGPVYLRSSNHNLPDFVADLHGLVDVEAVARIDSKNGGIRATFNRVPDVPITKVVVNLQGGKKGLIVNSRNLCLRKSRAELNLTAHNGRQRDLRPQIRAQCGKKRQAKRSKHTRVARR